MTRSIRWLTLLLALLFVITGVSKLADVPPSPENFERWGLSLRFMHGIGAVEVVSGVLLLSPSFTTAAALVLIGTMGGALRTGIVYGEAMHVALPGLLIALLAGLLIARRRRARGYFRGKTVLITGASSGIGAALARELAARGAQLVLAARRLELLEALVSETRAAGAKAIAVTCDVTRAPDLERAVATARKELGGVDVVVANAGFGVNGAVSRIASADFRRQFDTNVMGVVETVYACLPEIEKRGGAIALVGSVMGHISMPESSAYAMSKFAVTALADSLWYELRRTGVSVTLISPGFIRTQIRNVRNDGSYAEGDRDPVPGWLSVSAEKAARAMADAIALGTREEVLTWHGKIAVWIYRYAPWLVHAVVGTAYRAR